MSRIYKSLLALALIALLLLGCARDETPTAEPTKAEVEQVVEEPTTAPDVEPEQPTAESQKRTITIAQSVDPRTLDPHETTAPYLTISAQIVEPLIYFSEDADGTTIIKKHLATDYRWLDDLTLQFDLRDGVSFSNGEPFDAVATLQFRSTATIATGLF